MSWKRRWFVLDVESTQFSFFALIVPFFSELIFSYYTFLLRNRGPFPEAYWYFCSYQGGLCTPNFVSSDIAPRTPKSPPPRKPLRKVKKKVIILLVTITLRWPVFFSPSHTDLWLSCLLGSYGCEDSSPLRKGRNREGAKDA